MKLDVKKCSVIFNLTCKEAKGNAIAFGLGGLFGHSNSDNSIYFMISINSTAEVYHNEAFVTEIFRQNKCSW